MPFSFKPTQGTETQIPDPGQAPGVVGASSGSLSFGSRDGGSEGKNIIDSLLSGAFVLTIIVTVGLFGYQYYLKSEVADKKSQLDAYEKKLGVLPLDDMRKLSNRLKVISQLIKDHPSVNAAFRIIEKSVEFPITYNRFDLSYSDSLHAYQLQLEAVAPDYRSVIEQIDTLKRKPFTTYISDISVEGVRPNDKGQIVFGLKMPLAIVGVSPEALNLFEEVPFATSTTYVAPFTNGTTSPSVQSTSTVKGATGQTSPSGFFSNSTSSSPSNAQLKVSPKKP